MTAPTPPTIRQLLAGRIESSSPARVAEEIGIPESDLRGFQAGIALASAHAHRLNVWYDREVPEAALIFRAPPSTPARRVNRPAPVAAPAPVAPAVTMAEAAEAAQASSGGAEPISVRAASPEMVETVREYVRARVLSASVRQIAAEIGGGMKRGALNNFVRGRSQPQARLWGALSAWYNRETGAGGSGDTASGAASRRVDSASEAEALGISQSTLRRYFAEEVKNLGLRPVAREVGFSSNPLRQFLNGTTVALLPRTRLLLGLYYVARKGRPSDPAGEVAQDADRQCASLNGGSDAQPPSMILRPCPTTENSRDLPMEIVRELARDRSEQRSLRYAADQIGLTISTLHNFLRGSRPQPRIRRKLAEWYVREVARRGEAFPEGTYVSAVQVLVAPLPAEGRTDATEDVIAVLERLHDKHGLNRPVWVERLRSGEEVPRLV